MKAKSASEERPVVQTVKLEPSLFVKLKTFGAKTRRSNQDILHSALVIPDENESLNRVHTELHHEQCKNVTCDIACSQQLAAAVLIREPNE